MKNTKKTIDISDKTFIDNQTGTIVSLRNILAYRVSALDPAQIAQLAAEFPRLREAITSTLRYLDDLESAAALLKAPPALAIVVPPSTPKKKGAVH
jgi:hypothetical protein